MRHNQSNDQIPGTYHVSNQVENPYQLFIAINFNTYQKNLFDMAMHKLKSIFKYIIQSILYWKT